MAQCNQEGRVSGPPRLLSCRKTSVAAMKRTVRQRIGTGTPRHHAGVLCKQRSDNNEGDKRKENSDGKHPSINFKAILQRS